MPVKSFGQEDFLNFEDSSSGLDFLSAPGQIILGKDPTSFLNGLDIEINRGIVSTGLIDSYRLDPLSLTSRQKRSRSETTDNALLAIYFTVTNQADKAKTIYQYYQLSLPPFFTSGHGLVPDWVNLSNNDQGATQALSTAYLLYSVCYYMTLTKNTQFRPLALFCAQQLMDLKSTSFNVIRDNYSTAQCSNEENVIAYLGFKMLISFTNDSDIIDFTDSLKASLTSDLGLKDNTNSPNFSENSVIFAGIFGFNIGYSFLTNSAQTFLEGYYFQEEGIIRGIGSAEIDEKQTLMATLFYHHLGRDTLAYSFNTSLVELLAAKGGFTSIDSCSSTQSVLLFLLLNQALSGNFLTQELFR